jgi:2,3-bisphosphoglycerate-independent phosphoglycerate mutase
VVDVLVILDGASEPLRPGGEPTSLELARTPALDRLAREGELTRVRTVAHGLAPGSEAAIPALLGWTPTAPVDRGALEAAAHGIDVAEGERAWRVDLPSTAGTLALSQCHELHDLRGHRRLVVGPSPLVLVEGSATRVWAEGILPPRILGADTVLVGARGAAVGVARLMGAATVVPAGATGLPSSDLAAKASAAIAAIDDGAARVVVHVGGPDEAAHQRDPAAKIAAIERADRELVGPLAEAVHAAGGTLTVCPDHGCDPKTGAHDADPVPSVTWSPADAALRRELERALAPRRRLTERAVAGLPEVLPAAVVGAVA